MKTFEGKKVATRKGLRYGPSKKRLVEDHILYNIEDIENETPRTIDHLIAHDNYLMNEPIFQAAIEQLQKENY